MMSISRRVVVTAKRMKSGVDWSPKCDKELVRDCQISTMHRCFQIQVQSMNVLRTLNISVSTPVRRSNCGGTRLSMSETRRTPRSL